MDYSALWMNQLRMERTSAPRSAAPKPATKKFGTMSVIAQKRSALSTKEKSPNVITVMGNVRTCNTGFTTIEMTDHTRATSSVVSHPPVVMTPGTMETVSITAATVPAYRNTVCIRLATSLQLLAARHNVKRGGGGIGNPIAEQS